MPFVKRKAEVIFQGCFSLLQFFFCQFGVSEFREFPEDLPGGFKKTVSVVYARCDEFFVFPDKGLT
ncbi:MAG: hypothetical protein U9N82_12965 [Thermodesulfobacteriota bacterium]|nr:hypothetical protein [Thermodesulfobacteriota bacterium]